MSYFVHLVAFLVILAAFAAGYFASRVFDGRT